MATAAAMAALNAMALGNCGGGSCNEMAAATAETRTMATAATVLMMIYCCVGVLSCCCVFVLVYCRMYIPDLPKYLVAVMLLCC